MSIEYVVREWRIDVGALTLIGSAGRVSLEPRTMALLEHFCRHPGVTLSKDELLDAVWGSEHFTDSVVTRAVSLLRGSLGDSPDASRYIQTVPRRGYRFVAPVEVVDASVAPLPGRSHDRARARPRRWLVALVVVAALAMGYVLLRQNRSEPATRQLAHLDSVAIAPFTIEESVTSTGFPIEGLQVDVASQLARLQQPRVFLVDRTPEFADDAQWSDLPAVDGLLTGRAFVRDDDVVVELRLLGLASRELVWSSEYSVERGQSFLTREHMVRDLALLSRTGLARWERRVQREPVDSEAYETYLEALWRWRQRSFESLAEGQRLFERAVSIDPGFADAQAGLALSYIARVSYGREARDVGYQAAERAAEAALRLDPENPQALTAQGQLALQRDWDFPAAVDWYVRAIAASPSALDARQYLAEALSVRGQHRSALVAIEEALVLRPDSALLRAIKGMIQTSAGEYAGAVATFEALDAERPGFDWYRWYWSFAVHRSGDPVEAARIRARRFDHRIDAGSMQTLLRAIDAQGESAFWQWQLERLKQLDTRHVAIHATLQAEAQAALGQADAAMESIRTAIALRGEAFPMLRISPQFDALRARGDYASMLRSNGLEVAGLD